MTPGQFLLKFYHTPVGRIRDSLRHGGPWQERRTLRGREAMELAARELPLLAAGDGRPVELHLLTGRRFWYQTAFCLWSFARHARRPLAPVIHDDGSLTAEFREPLARLFPATSFVAGDESQARLDAHLPTARYPVLRERWLNYPNIRKLIAPHLGRSGWKLVIDSDLLFFRRPEFLLDWLEAPARPFHAVDCATSYGYSRPLLDTLAGAPLAELVNVGLTGLDSAAIDWDRLEQWTRELHVREGTSYYLEQALIAMLVAGRDCAVAPAADYVTLPQPPEALECRAVMHHYVAESKRWYFQRNWRQALLAP
ncbi:MAG: hypothetical protein JWQ62_2924 [Lacunisphaera sp.]|nr:hypothetical protein [Lacunisphaera sp.]